MFLAALAEGWSVSSSSERAACDRHRFYELRAEDEAFAEKWAEAYEAATEMLEDELRRRSVEGWDEETFDGGGKLIRRVRRMLPHDLHLQLKARRPEVYRENARVDVRAAGLAIGGPILESSLGRPVTGLSDVIALATLVSAVSSALTRCVMACLSLSRSRRWRSILGRRQTGVEADDRVWHRDLYLIPGFRL